MRRSLNTFDIDLKRRVSRGKGTRCCGRRGEGEHRRCAAGGELADVQPAAADGPVIRASFRTRSRLKPRHLSRPVVTASAHQLHGLQSGAQRAPDVDAIGQANLLDGFHSRAADAFARRGGFQPFRVYHHHQFRNALLCAVYRQSRFRAGKVPNGQRSRVPAYVRCTNFFFDISAFYNHYHDLFSEDITGGVVYEATPAPAASSGCRPSSAMTTPPGATTGFGRLLPEWRLNSYRRVRVIPLTVAHRFEARFRERRRLRTAL